MKRGGTEKDRLATQTEWWFKAVGLRSTIKGFFLRPRAEYESRTAHKAIDSKLPRKASRGGL